MIREQLLLLIRIQLSAVNQYSILQYDFYR